MTSIRHFPATHPLPDWRNFGVMLRVLCGANLLAALAALIQAPHLADWPATFFDMVALVEPVLLFGLGFLSLLRDFLWRLPIRLGQGFVVLLLSAMSYGFTAYAQTWLAVGAEAAIRGALLSALGAIALLGYFELRSRAFSPAQTEARLAALNARIRPHFLFNSLNAVLSLIRARPQQAELALEALSDLFRAAMRDPGELVCLADEVSLGRQYLELEQLRLGERLKVDWQIGDMPLDLPIPPLMLQPLLENAVYHGIEPAPEGGTVRIVIARRGEELRILIANPTAGQVEHATGNRMAVANIRERLALYYDLEARLEIEAGPDEYEVSITLPCRRKNH